MDIIKLAAEALDKTHVTMWQLGCTPDAHSDDEEEIETGSIQVTIFSERDEVELAQKIKKLLIAADFTWTAGDQDDTLNDGGIFVKPQRFSYQEVTEE